MSKELKIYKEDVVILSLVIEACDITTYSKSVDITCTFSGLTITLSIPLEQDYKIVAVI